MRRLLVSFALAVPLAALAAAPALGAPEGAQKAPLFEAPAQPEDGCLVGGPPGTISGFAVLNTPGNDQTLTGEVSLKRGEPNTTYEVVVEQHFVPGEVGCAETFDGTLTTNSKGKGNHHINLPRIPGTTTFSVELESPLSGPEFVTSEVELD